ncbi:hypothetical protein [Pararhodobacter oceanensis]|uniref:Transposase IS66 C-terminal domain-containing protein n=1 Tax=Pararhodobacter oceanensis TaxID=2172121 RepID=A0A2T8HPP5_9RHOB|nr:hypothetical protein [Pararhodobacter oceanensis]PVH27386.1 hypothetical protein DDE20_17850 [Pararhodobacter oceanensis]
MGGSTGRYLSTGLTGGDKAAANAFTLIETARMNGANPGAWLASFLEDVADPKMTTALLDGLIHRCHTLKTGKTASTSKQTHPSRHERSGRVLMSCPQTAPRKHNLKVGQFSMENLGHFRVEIYS